MSRFSWLWLCFVCLRWSSTAFNLFNHLGNKNQRIASVLPPSQVVQRFRDLLRHAKKSATLSIALGSIVLPTPQRVGAAGKSSNYVVLEQIGSKKQSLNHQKTKSITNNQQRQKTSMYDYFGNANNKNEREENVVSAQGGGGATQAGKRGKLLGASSFVREAVRSVGPSVVRIDCERDIPQMVTMFAPENFREGDTMKVSGSGFVVSSDGFILTNAHVVEGAKKTTISLSNGRSFKAVVVALDELTDLAVLKAEVTPSDSKYLTIAPLGDSAKLQSGDWVIAVGCPVGLDFTVTLGIVSSPKRSAMEVGATHLKGSYIQTDAALNSGNSGGPLVNDIGEVVGINTMVRTNTEAIGFAIPINRARAIYEVLKQGKKPTHAYFGIEVMTITPDFASIHNDDPNAQRLAQIHGALVTRVLPGSPAASSGLRKNDIIIEVNCIPIANSHDADIWLDQCKPGAAAKLKIARGETGGEVQLEAAPENLLTMIEEKNRRRGMGPVSKPKASFMK